MITNLSLSNFKSFRSLKDLKINDLTVISGKNSTGKSSIIQSLLLLKQSFNEDSDDALTLEGRYLHFSNLKEACFGLPVETVANIVYLFNVKDESGKDSQFSITFRYKKDNNSANKRVVVTDFTWTDPHGKQFTIKRYKGTFVYPKNNKMFQLPFRKVQMKSVLFKNFLPTIATCEVPVEERANLKTNLLRFPLAYGNDEYKFALDAIQNELHRLQYLGPVRAIPRRAYIHYSSSSFELDDDGSNAAYVFFLRKEERVQFKDIKVSLLEAVNEAFKLLGLTQLVTPHQYKKFVYQLNVTTPYTQNKKVTIADVGFGYSQLLPIILRGFLSEKGALIIFEQPEIHLHPSSCGNLADLFLLFIDSGKRVMVETHSSDLIHRLRLRAIENPAIIERLNVCFVEQGLDSHKGSDIRQLTLKPNGSFSQWPDGFLDDSEKQARKIILAKALKR